MENTCVGVFLIKLQAFRPVSAFHFCSLDRKLEGYEKCALRKEPVIAPFVERFKTATLRKSY